MVLSYCRKHKVSWRYAVTLLLPLRGLNERLDVLRDVREELVCILRVKLFVECYHADDEGQTVYLFRRSTTDQFTFVTTNMISIVPQLQGRRYVKNDEANLPTLRM